MGYLAPRLIVKANNYTYFFREMPVSAVFDLLRPALLPPVVHMSPDTRIGSTTFENLIQQGLYVTSQVPLLSGIQLRALAQRSGSELWVHLNRMLSKQDNFDWHALEEFHLHWECMTRELYSTSWSYLQHYGLNATSIGFNAFKIPPTMWNVHIAPNPAKVLFQQRFPPTDCSQFSLALSQVNVLKTNTSDIHGFLWDTLVEQGDMPEHVTNVITLLQMKFTETSGVLDDIPATLKKLHAAYKTSLSSYPNASTWRFQRVCT
jgi:hypothetical protein